MNEAELLLWARGPGLQWALGLFLFGMVVRAFELFSLGRGRDLAPPRVPSPGSGWRTIIMRSVPPVTVWRHAPSSRIGAYVFHIGLLVTVAFFAPHIQLIRDLLGLSWPALPTPWVDAVTLITLAALMFALGHRLRDPVKRFLSGPGDYFAWGLTVLPVATGYLAFHHQLLPYTLMLALHILSAELLLALMPFTKLFHFATVALARWYNGDLAGRKGVAV